jgi:DNA polymerase-4
LEAELWPLCEKLSARLKRAELAGGTITLKLKTADFKLRTRSRKLMAPTLLAEVIFREARPLLSKETDGTAYRLIGIGAADFVAPNEADPVNLLDPSAKHRAEVEHAIDKVRAKFGSASIGKGRGLLPRR